MKILKSGPGSVEVLVLENRGDVVLRFDVTTEGVRCVSRRHAYQHKRELAFVPTTTFNKARAMARKCLREERERAELQKRQPSLDL